MRVVLTGATGIAGRAIARHLLREGVDLVTLGRRPIGPDVPHVAWALGERPAIGCDGLVHCAFSHAPGRYRGGEGDDPEAFLRRNRDGTLRLLEAVPAARMVFLSSRAVYDGYPPGTPLAEELPPRPDTLYGRLKAELEVAVADRGGTSLRATGLYGDLVPGRAHKWSELFTDFAAGRPITPRVATELHVDDLAQAVAICLGVRAPSVLNASDLVLDRRDLLALYAGITGIHGLLPERGDPDAVKAMCCAALRGLGWTPRGMAGLGEALRSLVRPAGTRS